VAKYQEYFVHSVWGKKIKKIKKKGMVDWV
jgi:hypothetical protein